MIKTSLASNIVPTPTVNDNFGTLFMSLSKNLELALIVSAVNSLSLALEVRDYPGSLNAI